MAVQIQMRRDVAADWTSANPVLAEGELGLETDTAKWKIGDGATAWTSLGYVNQVVAGPASVSNSGASPALTITNTGSGYSLLVEDSASTDSTPVVIDATGKVGVGTASPTANLHVKADWISNEGQISADVPSGGTYSGITMRNDGTIKGLAIWDNSGSQLLLSVPATTGKVVLGYNSTSPQISADMSTGATSIYGSGTERFKIDSAGLITGTGTSLGAWTAYTPTVTASTTNPTGHTAVGAYIRIGKMVVCRVRVTFAATAGSGTYSFTAPLAIATIGSTGWPHGSASLYDASTGKFFGGAVSPANNTTFQVWVQKDSTGLGWAQATDPLTMDANDMVQFTAIYETSA